MCSKFVKRRSYICYDHSVSYFWGFNVVVRWWWWTSTIIKWTSHQRIYQHCQSQKEANYGQHFCSWCILIWSNWTVLSHLIPTSAAFQSLGARTMTVNWGNCLYYVRPCCPCYFTAQFLLTLDNVLQGGYWFRLCWMVTLGARFQSFDDLYNWDCWILEIL